MECSAGGLTHCSVVLILFYYYTIPCCLRFISLFEVVRNSQRRNGYGRSGVNKKIRRGGTGASRKTCSLCLHLSRCGFFLCVCLIFLWLHHSHIHPGKIELHLSHCHPVNRPPSELPPSNFQNGKRKENKKI